MQQAIEIEAPKRTIEKRFETLRDRHKTVQDAHRIYIESITDDTTDADVDSWINEVCNVYDTLEIKTDVYLEDVDKRANEASLLEVESKRKKISEDKLIIRDLERMKLQETIKTLESILSDDDNDVTRSDRVKAGLCSLSKRIHTCEIAHKEYLIDLIRKRKENGYLR